MMQYITLGKTDLKVSRLCLGCMTFGEPDRGTHAWTLPEESSRPIIKQALDAGINFFDTANSYSDGSSEEIVGRALKDFAKRDDIVVATKVFYPITGLKADCHAPLSCNPSTTACADSAWSMSICCKSTAGITTRRLKKRWKR